MPITDVTTGQEHILGPLCKQWLRQIKDAKKRKWELFGQYAVEGMKFYDGTHNWMWRDEEKSAGNNGGFLSKGAALPTFRMQVNRMFEAVALFGPALYHQNPDILVTPIDPPFIDPINLGINPQDPAMQQQYMQLTQMQQQAASKRKLKAQIKSHYLNWLQVECDKKTHARRSITEAIIKGMGVLWTSVYQPRGSQIKYPFSQHISVDDIVVDPDAEYWEDVQYIARYCCHPVNLVEKKFNLPPGSLKGHIESSRSQGQTYGSSRETSRRRRRGKTHDLIEYYEIYSKNGFGDQLRTTTGEIVNEKLNFGMFGDFCKIVVSEGIPFPLNLPTWALSKESEEEIMERVQWEVPYWTSGGWPMTRLTFYEKPRSVWPVSITKAAVGEMRFVNWCMSFLADKTAAACTTYVAQMKSAGIEIQSQLKNNMAPYTVIEISEMTGRRIDEIVTFLDAPGFSSDIWRMLSEVLDMVDKRTGLTDLVYGMTNTQLRSATEADIKQSQTNIRPDDMAGRVEDFLSETALNEMAACVWSCEGSDVAPVLGEIGAAVFTESIQTQDFEKVIRDYDYRVASGSARKPNKSGKQRALSDLGNVILPSLQEYAMQGNVKPWNAYITEFGKTIDIDVAGFLLEPPQQEEGPSAEEQAAQMEMQMKQLEMQMKQAEFDMKQKSLQQESLLRTEESDEQLQISQDTHVMEMRQDAEVHSQEMQQAREEADVELLMKKAELAMMTKEQELKLIGLKKMQAATLAAKKAQAEAQEDQSENKESEDGGSA